MSIAEVLEIIGVHRMIAIVRLNDLSTAIESVAGAARRRHPRAGVYAEQSRCDQGAGRGESRAAGIRSW